MELTTSLKYRMGSRDVKSSLDAEVTAFEDEE